ncbi:unnamed protein product [Effrenium voratum]|uniref:Uncharacterized protein n=1 Tax=Effrenium voratum TaxID=2562239 RepID=A0AA36MTF1_9DINO|nr:unnamed protein product [Effrenium voratum]
MDPCQELRQKHRHWIPVTSCLAGRISIGDRRSASLLSEDDKVVRLRRVSKEVTGKEISFLSRGFVVNFRRLMELQKVFAIIHELIKSTAIAALTLVLAGDVWQLGYSVMFVAILFLIYAFHAAHYDTMDISDYRHLVDLLEDDNGICGGRSIENPNRLLKALSLARTGRRRRAVVIILLFGMLCSGMWTLVGYSWTMELEDTGIWQIGGEFYATLLLVGTLMLIFHAAFEWLYWRETQCVMPVYRSKTGSEPWDPSVHGTPRRFRWFGLPSMWFTSNQAYADLSLWIQHAKGNDGARKVNKVFPEEMALFSLNATGACQLRKTLKSAKLYSVHRGSFLSRAKTALGDLPRASDPEELCVDFVFFDTQSREYLQPEEEYKETQVHALGPALGSSDSPNQPDRSVAMFVQCHLGLEPVASAMAGLSDWPGCSLEPSFAQIQATGGSTGIVLLVLAAVFAAPAFLAPRTGPNVEVDGRVAAIAAGLAPLAVQQPAHAYDSVVAMLQSWLVGGISLVLIYGAAFVAALANPLTKRRMEVKAEVDSMK